jgi:hypothetical protein
MTHFEILPTAINDVTYTSCNKPLSILVSNDLDIDTFSSLG